MSLVCGGGSAYSALTFRPQGRAEGQWHTPVPHSGGTHEWHARISVVENSPQRGLLIQPNPCVRPKRSRLEMAHQEVDWPLTLM